MGYWKQKMIEEQERGWTSLGDKYVCSKCLEDYALANFVAENAQVFKCDYCGRRSRKKAIATPVDQMMELIDDGIRSEWGHPDDEGVPYETAEGGYQGKVLDTYGLVHEELQNPFANDKLCKDVIDAFTNAGSLWCQKDFFGVLPQDGLRFEWEIFVRIVKFSKRYLFSLTDRNSTDSHDYDDFSPGDFLSQLGEIVTTTGLVRQLPAGTTLYRARVHSPEKEFRTASELGTPRSEAALFSNRMSPAGIPMFYGAFNDRTAIDETYDPKRDRNVVITVGEFRTARQLPVVDLTRLPPIPSIFDEDRRESRANIIFLYDFMEDLQKPIARDGREHIDYVPTQVVTEYFRHLYKNPDHGRIMGILYPSVRTRETACCVLFFTNEQCCDVRKGWQKEKEKFFPDEPKNWLGLDCPSIRRIIPP